MSQALITQPQAEDRKPNIVAGGAIRAMVPQTVEEAYRLASAISRSGLAPKDFNTPEKVMVAIMAGMEIGLPPMQALQSIAVVNGRPAIWGDGLLALVRGSGLCAWVRETITGEGDAMTAICTTQRIGEPEPRSATFSVADAKRAGLWGKSGPWSQYPKRMLQMRARGFCLRDVYADALRGVIAHEEVEDVAPVTYVAPKMVERDALRLAATQLAPADDAPTVTEVADDAAVSQDPPHDPETGEVTDDDGAMLAAIEARYAGVYDLTALKAMHDADVAAAPDGAAAQITGLYNARRLAIQKAGKK